MMIESGAINMVDKDAAAGEVHFGEPDQGLKSHRGDDAIFGSDDNNCALKISNRIELLFAALRLAFWYHRHCRCQTRSLQTHGNAPGDILASTILALKT